MGARLLRVGIIGSGRILEERHLRGPDLVTVGQDAQNTFVIRSTHLPSTLPLFEYRDGQYHLLLTEGLEGRVRLEGGDVEFRSLLAQGLAEKNGDRFSVALPQNAKGKVSFGDVTVLFQSVEPAADEPLAAMSSYHRPWYRAREPLFMAVLTVSLVFHLVLAVALYLSPKPVESDLTLEELPDRFARVMMPPQLAPVPMKEKVTADSNEAQEARKEEKDDAPPSQDDAEERKAAIQQKVASKGLLRILGSGGGEGAFEDVLGESTGAGDIANALAGAAGVGVAATADAIGTGGPKGGGAGKVAGIGDVGTSGGGKVNLGSKGDVVVSGKVRDVAPEVDSADVDRDALARYVRARLKAIQNCYERELKRNPTLKGKVVVRFSIQRSGRAGDIEVEENTLGNEGVGSCIRTVIRSWIFPFKPDDDVPVAYPFVFLACVLAVTWRGGFRRGRV